jgi:hypothetical protein
MASAHEPGEVTWVEVPGGRLAVEVNSQDSAPVLASRLARLNREFPSVREYAEFFARTASLLDRVIRCCSTTSPTTFSGRWSGSTPRP